MKIQEKIESLKGVELFSALSDDELHEIAKRLVIRSFRKSETILFESDTNEYMYIILDGEVKAVQTTEDGKEIILAMHHAGELFGEISLIDGKTIPARVVAVRDSLTVIISKREFFSLVENDRIRDRFLQILCARLRQSWEIIQMLNFNNASQRVRMLLLILSQKYGKKTDGEVVLNVKLTHQSIAEMTGLTRETVTRVIDKWQRDGYVTILKDKRIYLRSRFCNELLI
jgi:CRP/FNR family transcriptional regulator, cyclic AMP receptor protein